MNPYPLEASNHLIEPAISKTSRPPISSRDRTWSRAPLLSSVGRVDSGCSGGLFVSPISTPRYLGLRSTVVACRIEIASEALSADSSLQASRNVTSPPPRTTTNLPSVRGLQGMKCAHLARIFIHMFLIWLVFHRSRSDGNPSVFPVGAPNWNDTRESCSWLRARESPRLIRLDSWVPTGRSAHEKVQACTCCPLTIPRTCYLRAAVHPQSPIDIGESAEGSGLCRPPSVRMSHWWAWT